ncbi:hypothetical protein DPMN_128645 [Dreissena polymorpha]|uniref:Uncharacterized protein n=1 Tax=Dreissena polymorpha TaxID=45954 RepID=A0A9D4H194_DREPO|nr:hypothetical protein DPMN_128645 [Dreissena polymorpha]
MSLPPQISILVLWPIHDVVTSSSSELTWTIPVSLLLISIGWWENYINKFTRMGRLGLRLKEFKHKVNFWFSYLGLCKLPVFILWFL